MRQKFKRHLPAGIKLLCVFYLINTLLFFLTTLIFSKYLDTLLVGNKLSVAPAIFLKLILILLPMYLTFGLYYLRRDALRLALWYHLFFVLNGAATLLCLINNSLKLRPLLEIALKPEYKITRMIDLFGTPFHIYIIQILGIIIGIIIGVYLFKKRAIFTA